MTLETFQDFGHDLSVPRFTVEVGDREFDETSGLVSSVRVEQVLDGADRFELSLAPRWDHEDAQFVDFSWADFPVYESVTIDLGYGSDLETIVDGWITEHSTDFPSSGTPSISVSGYGQYYALTNNVVQEDWKDKTDSEIAEAIADAYGLAAEVDDTPIERSKVENPKDSDAAFLDDKLAPRNDIGNGPFEVFVRVDELVFRAPRDYSEPEFELQYGESLQSFSPTFTEAQGLAKVVVRDWSTEEKANIVGVAEADDGGSEERTVSLPVRSEAEAEAIARAILHRSENDQLEGDGETVGLPEITVGEPIKLSGLGNRFSTAYYVEEVTHTIDSSGYATSFSVRLPNHAVAPFSIQVSGGVPSP